MKNIHRDIKNFKHLIDIVNKAISRLSDSQIEELGIGDEEFYYKYVYRMIYCDDWLYHLIHTDDCFVTVNYITQEYDKYITTGEAF